MDVNLTISLMRGQMGAVIEKAVNVAVETVLGEMIRVVGLKFEDIKREMSAKEKENDTIRKMLESSRCEIKTMRKYMSLLDAKVSRDKLHQHGHRAAAAAAAAAMVGVKAPRPGGGHLARTSLTRHQWQAAYETLRCDNQSGGDAAGSCARKGENSCTHLVDSQGLLSNIPTDLSDPVWFQNPLDSAEPVPTDISGRLSPCIITDESAASQSSGAPLLKVKQEDAEIQITCVKDEPSEDVSICSFEYSNPELDQSQVPLDLPRSLQGLQSPGTSADLAFIVGESASYEHTQMPMPGLQRRVYGRHKDLYEYKCSHRGRVPNPRRAPTRRHELEQSLPQALLADLVRERREKTRLRVARWRAKRKLQACLMASQFHDGPVAGTSARGGLMAQRRRGGATGRGLTESGTYNLMLQLGPGPANQGLVQPGSSGALAQHRTPTQFQ